MKPLLQRLRVGVTTRLSRMGGWLGREQLDRSGTAALLQGAGIRYEPGVPVELETGRHVDALDILSFGVVRANRRLCLDFDYGTRSSIMGWTGGAAQVERAAVLWSHPWMGYYHWIIDILPKICQLLSDFGPDLGGYKFCYPSSNCAYERETLDLLGISNDAVLDTRRYRTLSVKRVWAMPLPGWEQILPQVELVRDRLLPFASGAAGDRIYLSRKGRRRCVNEEEVWDLLKSRGFAFVEDRPRTVREQIGIFANAKAIVGPHGAAFTNLLWCSPGTKVIELMSAGYRPKYYENLSGSRSLSHEALISRGGPEHHWSRVEDAVLADLPALERILDQEALS